MVWSKGCWCTGCCSGITELFIHGVTVFGSLQLTLPGCSRLGRAWTFGITLLTLGSVQAPVAAGEPAAVASLQPDLTLNLTCQSLQRQCRSLVGCKERMLQWKASSQVLQAAQVPFWQSRAAQGPAWPPTLPI